MTLPPELDYVPSTLLALVGILSFVFITAPLVQFLPSIPRNIIGAAYALVGGASVSLLLLLAVEGYAPAVSFGLGVRDSILGITMGQTTLLMWLALLWCYVLHKPRRGAHSI